MIGGLSPGPGGGGAGGTTGAGSLSTRRSSSLRMDACFCSNDGPTTRGLAGAEAGAGGALAHADAQHASASAAIVRIVSR